MTSNNPHYLLFAEASRNPNTAQTWRFVLQNLDTHRRFCATDAEPTDCGERLELLAVVRGLEALEGPSRVTLVTKSRYVSRGLKSGLTEWRAADWRWERFGRVVPVRDHDLWQRVDRALEFHEVDCQTWHFDESLDATIDESAAETAVASCVQHPGCREPQRVPEHSTTRLPGLMRALARPVREVWSASA